MDAVAQIVAGTALAIASGGVAAAVVALRKAAKLKKRSRRTERQLAIARRDVDTLRRRLYRQAAASALHQTGRTPAFSPEFRSEFGEDAFLWEVFGGKPDGFFIEVGAFDGQTLSVTYAFEAVGWTGVLIEAIPARFEQCRRARPGSRVVHGALGAKGSSGTTRFTVAEGIDVLGESLQTLSFRHGLPGHEQEIRKRGGTPTEVTVPLTTMDAVLAAHQGPIDFASIDVEGAEAELLDGFDLARFRPRVLLVEDGTAGRNTQVPAMLDAAGYVGCGWIGYNRVYIRREEKDLVAKAVPLLSPEPMFADP